MAVPCALTCDWALTPMLRSNQVSWMVQPIGGVNPPTGIGVGQLTVPVTEGSSALSAVTQLVKSYPATCAGVQAGVGDRQVAPVVSDPSLAVMVVVTLIVSGVGATVQ